MAQAAPLAGLHCPMVAVPRPPRAAARKLRLLSARTAGRPLKRRASVRARASTCSFDLRRRKWVRSRAYRAQRQAPLPLRFAAGAFTVALRAECQRAHRIRAQHPTRTRVNARKSSYGMKQSTDQSICKNERTAAGIPQRKQTNSNQCH